MLKRKANITPLQIHSISNVNKNYLLKDKPENLLVTISEIFFSTSDNYPYTALVIEQESDCFRTVRLFPDTIFSVY